MNATARPWRTEANHPFVDIYEEREGGTLIATTEVGTFPEEICRANAALIVEAVNNHDRLTQELAQAREALKKIASGDYHPDKACYSIMGCCNGAEDIAKEALHATDTKRKETPEASKS